MALTGPNVNISNNPQTVTGGDMGVVLNGGTAGITLVDGNITTSDSITAGSISSTGDLSAVNATLSGNLSLASTKNILGDFSNATGANRTSIKSSTTNGYTYVSAVPNGTSTSSAFLVENSSTRTNSSTGNFYISNVGVGFQSSFRGAGTLLPLNLYMGTTRAIGIDQLANVQLGISNMTTASSGGFPYIPAVAGIPTGTPLTIAGYAPLVIDSTNNKMYFYSGGAWNALN